MKKNLKELNPDLEGGDRIVLIFMDDYTSPVPMGSIGIVDSEKPKLNQPIQQKGDCGFAYNVKWYEKDEETGELKFISKLPLIPEGDSWIFDKDYYKQ
jgi:hypothetical protein